MSQLPSSSGPTPTIMAIHNDSYLENALSNIRQQCSNAPMPSVPLASCGTFLRLPHHPEFDIHFPAAKYCSDVLAYLPQYSHLFWTDLSGFRAQERDSFPCIDIREARVTLFHIHICSYYKLALGL